MDQPRTPDTKERILDAAERLFAERGFFGTSLRNITALAGVNLAAVNYHFGSKETLIEAVLTRRLVPLNRERLELLEAARSRAGTGAVPVARIIEVFIAPPIRMSHDPRRGGADFMRLLGHAMNQPVADIRKMLALQFREVAEQFSAALGQALPDLDPPEILWRMLFMVGSMAHSMVMADEMRIVTRGVCDGSDVEETIRRLVPFLTAAMNSPAPGELREETP